MDTALLRIAVALALCAVTGALAGRLAQRPFYALLALAALIMAIRSIHRGNPPSAAVDAALTAYYAWRWWKSGGGDDTKRRLRGLARRFTPVRRTAPSTA
ncbi:hypothetical protein ACFYMW_39100 [Streptomyces sp. NPDC006692]|uniref:hypothetical protein n=1 Tax=unclassified Streptomyces TaxID=2593676 RepID=UPI003681C45F